MSHVTAASHRPFRTARHEATLKLGRIAKPTKKTAPPRLARYYWVTGFYGVMSDTFSSWTRGNALVVYDGHPLTYRILLESQQRGSTKLLPSNAICLGLFAPEINAADFARLAPFNSYELAPDTARDKGMAFVLPFKQ